MGDIFGIIILVLVLIALVFFTRGAIGRLKEARKIPLSEHIKNFFKGVFSFFFEEISIRIIVSIVVTILLAIIWLLQSVVGLF